LGEGRLGEGRQGEMVLKENRQHKPELIIPLKTKNASFQGRFFCVFTEKYILVVERGINDKY